MDTFDITNGFKSNILYNMPKVTKIFIKRLKLLMIITTIISFQTKVVFQFYLINKIFEKVSYQY